MSRTEHRTPPPPRAMAPSPDAPAASGTMAVPNATAPAGDDWLRSAMAHWLQTDAPAPFVRMGDGQRSLPR
ncbi:hypothetical protein [Aquabacterium sp.]|uniref:hypothetical protein n=1 Tax=Aquabacterium sp. TaxID=1872578 RepID=UPI0035C6DFFA